jgi:putative ABC transport system substrate-binding protein
MRYRTVGIIVLCTLGMLAAPLLAPAQKPGQVYRVGYLAIRPTIDEAFREVLRQLGYVEGHNLVLEGRFAQGQYERLPDLAAELVRLGVDVIVTISTPAALAAQHATTTLPIVMAGVSDPVERGLIASLARPGGNLTGITNNPGPGFTAKQLELLKDAAPTIARVGVFWDSTFLHEGFSEAQRAAQALGMTALSADVKDGQFDTLFAAMLEARAEALLVYPIAQNWVHTQRIVDFATAHRLPTLFGERIYVEAGGLMSYWASWADMRRRAAAQVGKILKGTKPADLPVEQPTKFELILNLKTAKTLGMTVPPSLLLLADEVLQ